jgi:hypothetical protein
VSGVLRTAVNAYVWLTCAGVTLTALMLAHLVGRAEELEARMLAMFDGAVPVR